LDCQQEVTLWHCRGPGTLADADNLARQARGLLGLAAVPVYDLIDRAASIGLLVFSRDLGVDTADAGTILLRQGAVSLVNSRNTVGRRRLALAHELGHYLVADKYIVDWRVVDQQGGDIESPSIALPGQCCCQSRV
jgi:hypothetical protein